MEWFPVTTLIIGPKYTDMWQEGPTLTTECLYHQHLAQKLLMLCILNQSDLALSK